MSEDGPYCRRYDLEEMKRAGLIQDYSISEDGRTVNILPVVCAREIHVDIGFINPSKLPKVPEGYEMKNVTATLCGKPINGITHVHYNEDGTKTITEGLRPEDVP